MIDDNKVVEILEFIQSTRGGNADYSELCASQSELANYLNYIYEKGFISNLPSSYISGNRKKQNVTTIKPVETFSEFELFTAIRISANGIDFLKESKKSMCQKFYEVIKKEAIPQFAKKFYYALFIIIGLIATIAFQYYTGYSFK